MGSKPDYDPNTVKQNWEALSTDENSVLLNRATQGLYAPGSTFKIVTALEYMREHSDYNSYSYNCTGVIEQEGTAIHCYGGNVHGPLDLQGSFAYSCNTSFSNIGLSLDPSAFQATSKELLFGKKLPCVLPAAKSSFTLSVQDGSAARMMTAWSAAITSFRGASVIWWSWQTPAPTMSGMPSGGMTICPLFRKTGCSRSQRTKHSSSRCCPLL